MPNDEIVDHKTRLASLTIETPKWYITNENRSGSNRRATFSGRKPEATESKSQKDDLAAVEARTLPRKRK